MSDNNSWLDPEDNGHDPEQEAYQPPADYLEDDDGEYYNGEGVVLYLIGSLLFWGILFVAWIVWVSAAK